MSDMSVERLLDDIGEIDELFIKEAEEFDFSRVKAKRNKRIIYSAAGVAILGGIVVMYRKLKLGHVLKSG